MKHRLVAAAIAISLAHVTSFAYAEETIPIETYCWDDGDGTNFQCTENMRLWAGATNLPVPSFDPNDPNQWPTKLTNYTTFHTISDADQRRCIDRVHSDPQWFDLAEDKIFVTCAARVDWVAPLAVATGSDQWFTFNDPIQIGESRDRQTGEVLWRGIIAKATRIACGCFARVNGPD